MKGCVRPPCFVPSSGPSLGPSSGPILSSIIECSNRGHPPSSRVTHRHKVTLSSRKIRHLATPTMHTKSVGGPFPARIVLLISSTILYSLPPKNADCGCGGVTTPRHSAGLLPSVLPELSMSSYQYHSLVVHNKQILPKLVHLVI